MKDSKHSGYRKSVYYTIVSYIKQHNKLPDLGISKQNRNRYIKRLKSDGVISKKGTGLWSVDMDKFEQLKFIEVVNFQRSDARIIRGHGFHYRLCLPKINRWHKRREYLEKKKILYEQSKANWEGYRIIIKGYKVWLCNNSLVIYAPRGRSFLNYTASLSKINALNEFFSVVRSVENLLGVNFKINNKYAWTVSKQHYAKVRDSFAKIVNQHSRKIVISYNNKEWLLFDRSFNKNEIETIQPSRSDKDMDHIIRPFFNGMKDHYLKTGEALTMNGLLQLMQAQQDQINTLIYKEPEELKPRDTYFG